MPKYAYDFQFQLLETRVGPEGQLLISNTIPKSLVSPPVFQMCLFVHFGETCFTI